MLKLWCLVGFLLPLEFAMQLKQKGVSFAKKQGARGLRKEIPFLGFFTKL